jgi:hypothetical protein
MHSSNKSLDMNYGIKWFKQTSLILNLWHML